MKKSLISSAHWLRSMMVLCAFATLGSAMQKDELKAAPTSALIMPDKVDEIHLSWVDGPPQLQAYLPEDQHLKGFREEHAKLGLRSDQWGLVLDPRKLTIPYLTLAPAADAPGELLSYEALQQSWDVAELDMFIDYRGKVYYPEAGPLLSVEDNYKYSPIHIIESGLWFQHIAIYDLVLRDRKGQVLEAESWIELRAWGDQLLIEWYVQPKVRGFTKLSMDLKTDASGLKRSVLSQGNRVQLSLTIEESGVADVPDHSGVEVSAKGVTSDPKQEPSVNYSQVTDAWEVKIPKLDWSTKSKAAYPEEYLDRVSAYDLTLTNTSDEVKDVRLRMIHNYHPLTGYVPVLLDREGKQTGLPIQNSKNWHALKDEPYPYEGSWINQTARLRLEPNSKVELRYQVVHALWQGLPASSAAQLSLVGWGFNGFWTQMALGAWGESICIQPGRTMRRAFITDVRPFMARSMYDMDYDWTSNMGGADLLKVVDAKGHYIPWVGSLTDYKMIGPNLSHVKVRERSADDRLRVEIDTYLPISASINRSYVAVRLDVQDDIDLSELALFQLGSDYYNDSRSTKIAWGHEDQLQQELQPTPMERGQVGDPMELTGNNPWLSLFGNASTKERVGQGMRGLIVRKFDANLSGKHYHSPWSQAIWTGKSLGAELQLDPEITRLHAGDSIEFVLEFVVFPISAESYFGSDADLKARLAEFPDNWKLVAHEAANQTMRVNGQEMPYPALLKAADIAGQLLKIESDGTLGTLTVTGLSDAGASWQMVEWGDGGTVPLGKRFDFEANPQVNYDVDSGDWTAVFSIQFNDTCRSRQFKFTRSE